MSEKMITVDEIFFHKTKVYLFSGKSPETVIIVVKLKETRERFDFCQKLMPINFRVN